MAEPKLNLAAPWPVVKEKIKETNIELTDEDLEYKPGQEEKLLDHLAGKMGMTRDNTKSWIESVSANKGKAS